MARGDHVFIYRSGYSHHGIDIGEGKVVHFESDPWRKMADTIANSESARINVTSLEDFARGAPINVRQYDLADAIEVVVRRAESRVGDRDYDVFANNCEHFAVWCKTGVHQSTQVDSLRNATKSVPRALAASAMIAKTARRLPGRAKVVGYGAAMAVTAGAFAYKYLEHRLDNYFRGES